PEHGEFWQSYTKHVSGSGCQVCGEIIRKKSVTNNKLSKKFKDLIQPEEYKLIPLTQGQFAKVDNEDFDRLKGINWCAGPLGYVVNKKFGRMHRYIMDCPEEMVVDHINHDTLDNRKNNLRIATHRQNNFNRTTSHESSSQYKGVSWNNEAIKWSASIRLNGEQIHLGLFKNEKEAAEAYDKKALELFGEFAYLNFPEFK